MSNVLHLLILCTCIYHFTFCQNARIRLHRPPISPKAPYQGQHFTLISAVNKSTVITCNEYHILGKPWLISKYPQLHGSQHSQLCSKPSGVCSKSLLKWRHLHLSSPKITAIGLLDTAHVHVQPRHPESTTWNDLGNENARSPRNCWFRGHYQWEIQCLYVFTIPKCNFQDIWSLRETSAKQNADGIWAKELGT